MSSLSVCELSGQPLAATSDEIVVTPSGHVCLKRLLLTKLTDNGGIDPFDDDKIPLVEKDLITLQKKERIHPPRPSVTSFPNLLSLLQTEYDNLVLELFDTRKLLEETRQELSQSLYQNDAATRVVARLSMERDQARQQLEHYQQQAASSSVQDVEMGDAAAAAAKGPTTTHEDEPPAKRSKTEETGKLPDEDVQILTSTWERLSQARKAQKKQLASQAVSPQVLEKLTETSHKAWHKARGKAGLLALRQVGNHLVTIGQDKQLIAYNHTEEKVQFAVASPKKYAFAGPMDANDQVVVVAATSTDKKSPGKTSIHTYHMDTGDEYTAPLELSDTVVVDVAVHPSQQHAVLTCDNGRILLCRLGRPQEPLKVLHTFTSNTSSTTTYTCGALHPDGLLHAAGTSDGHIHLWDFKSQTLASTLQKETLETAMESLVFSNNGYHLAAVTQQGSVALWDLKKGKTLWEQDDGGAVTSSAVFDVTGKYLVLAAEEKDDDSPGGVTVMSVKEHKTIVTLPDRASHVVWMGTDTIVTCSGSQRQVRFYGAKEE